MNITEIKERISIVDFLSKSGFEPKIVRRGEHVYLSPIRESDTDASFFVKDKEGKWFDHGLGQGGNIIDLGLHIFDTVSVKDVVRKISGIYEGDFKMPLRVLPEQVRPETKNDFEPNFEITSIKPIGTNAQLKEYLDMRGISEAVASKLLKEVYYKIDSMDEAPKRYFALGWQNEIGSWEVRNNYFKGCLGHKDLSVFNIEPERYNDKIAVFEGMLDYASWVQQNEKRTKAPAIVLNSLALMKKAVQVVEKFKVPYLFLDNDKSGVEAVSNLLKQFPNSVDQSDIYKGYKDYNEWQCSINRTTGLER
ncbi:MAG: hypothetical protein EOP34_04460 [Rickettsiales bacterium]|nr:MAG: hypothetical protein EOP34_04460 [Rickettsiales bacterium]